MARMTGPDCAVMFNLINIHRYIHTHIHTDGLGGEPSARNPDTPSTPAAETFNQSEQSSPSILFPG